MNTEEEFNRAWNAPNTMRMKHPTIAVLAGPDGARILLHHGGTTQAIEISRVDADDLARALGAV